MSQETCLDRVSILTFGDGVLERHVAVQGAASR